MVIATVLRSEQFFLNMKYSMLRYVVEKMKLINNFCKKRIFLFWWINILCLIPETMFPNCGNLFWNHDMRAMKMYPQSQQIFLYLLLSKRHFHIQLLFHIFKKNSWNWYDKIFALFFCPKVTKLNLSKLKHFYTTKDHEICKNFSPAWIIFNSWVAICSNYLRLQGGR